MDTQKAKIILKHVQRTRPETMTHRELVLGEFEHIPGTLGALLLIRRLDNGRLGGLGFDGLGISRGTLGSLLSVALLSGHWKLEESGAFSETRRRKDPR